MRLPVWLRRIIARMEAASSGYLAQVGWIETRALGLARDASGQPTPWFTYPAIRLLGDRVQNSWRVLEFGSGMGTVWWSGRVREVIAVEHDADWATSISDQCSAKVVHVDGSDADSYLAPALAAGTFDLVIIDGIHRETCLAAAPGLLADAGVIVLDDAQREEYRLGMARLLALGFRMLELHGPQPVSKHPGCTAFFYRSNNILGL
jgi:precorrin-6B methylase 2